MRARVGIILTLLVLAARMAGAQLCLGHPGFSAGTMHLGVNIGVDNDTRSAGIQASIGSRSGLFVSAQGNYEVEDAGGTFDDDPTGASVGGTLGYAIAVAKDERATFCPVLSMSWATVKGDFLGESMTVGATQFEFGGAFGYALPSSGKAVFTPFARISYARVDGTVKVAGQSVDLDAETYTPGVFGVGLVFNRTTGLFGAVTVPFGLEEADPSFSFGLQFVMGRRR